MNGCSGAVITHVPSSSVTLVNFLAERHRKIFEIWNSLDSGETLKIINDHDPKPLYYQFEAEHKGLFAWDYEQDGPVDWIVTIKKV